METKDATLKNETYIIGFGRVEGKIETLILSKMKNNQVQVINAIGGEAAAKLHDILVGTKNTDTLEEIIDLVNEQKANAEKKSDGEAVDAEYEDVKEE